MYYLVALAQCNNMNIIIVEYNILVISYQRKYYIIIYNNIMGAFLSIFECKQTVVDGESIELKPLPVEGEEQALPVEEEQALPVEEEQALPVEGQALPVEGQVLPVEEGQVFPVGEGDGQAFVDDVEESRGEIDDITFQSMIDQITQLDDIEQMKKYALNEIQLAQLAEKEQSLLAGGKKKRKRNSKKQRSSKKTVSSIRKSNRRKY